MNIKPLTAKDATQYRSLMLGAYKAEPLAFTSSFEERAALPESWWVDRLVDVSGLSVVLGAFQGEVLIGTTAMEFASKPKTAHKGHLFGMYVQAGVRGQGVGKALVQAALAAALVRPGIRVVTLTVTEGNQAAVALYESSGFKVFGLEPMAVATPQGFVSKIHMWRSLP